MVQKYQSPVRVYKYPFELVMAAYEKRFPTCPMIPVFVSSEIIRHDEPSDGSTQIIERRCLLNIDAPYLLKKIVGVEYVQFVQRNSLDRQNRTLKIEAYNESFANRLVINEVCTYSVHPENEEWTCFEQNASLDVKSFFGFETTVEKLAMKHYSHNIQKGKEIIEFYINELREQGITHVDLWQPTASPVENGEAEAEEEREGPGATPESKKAPSRANSIVKRRLSSTCVTATPAVVGEASDDVEVIARSNSTNKIVVNVTDSNKLDTDYIERSLGKLTPFQESKLVQFRKWVSESHKGKVPRDATLLRFLRARDFNNDKAREMLCHSLVWRKKYQVDKLLSEYDIPKVVADYYPGGWHKTDKVGRPLYVLRLGQMDVKGLIKSIGEDSLLKLALRVCEEGLQRTESATEAAGKPISTWTLVLDLEGLNMRHLWRPGIRCLLRIIEIVEANYPETLGLVLIVRAPRVFPILWTIVSTFIDERTRMKFLFYGGNDYQLPGGLYEYIDQDFVPDFLGGQAKTSICEGGLLSKSLYMSPEEYEREKSEDSLFFNDDSIYHSVSLTKGQVHEVLISNRDKGCVICWDFDVIREGVEFNVYLAKQLTVDAGLEHHQEQQHQQHTLTAPNTHNSTSRTDSTTSVSSNASSVEHNVFTEKMQWREGVDYVKAEPSLVCQDGESIQGSHLTDSEGSYILQWRFRDQSLVSCHSSAHKAKVMYFYEVIKSKDFRGSMSSLLSSNSEFSAQSSSTAGSAHTGVSSCPSR